MMKEVKRLLKIKSKAKHSFILCGSNCVHYSSSPSCTTGGSFPNS